MKWFREFYDGFTDVYVVLFTRRDSVRYYPDGLDRIKNLWFTLGNLCAILSIPLAVCITLELFLR